MTDSSAQELLVKLQPTIPSNLWLSFELRCDDQDIDIRAALILRESCELNGRGHICKPHHQRQSTIGSVAAMLCKWSGHLDLPSGYECLLNSAGALRDALVDQCELYGNGVDVFVIERMDIDPEYRGRDLGLAAMRALLHAFATGETLAAIRLAPTVPEGRTFSTFELRDAQDRLRKYWQRAGFERFARTDILVRAPTTNVTHPED